MLWIISSCKNADLDKAILDTAELFNKYIDGNIISYFISCIIYNISQLGDIFIKIMKKNKIKFHITKLLEIEQNRITNNVIKFLEYCLKVNRVKIQDIIVDNNYAQYIVKYILSEGYKLAPHVDYIDKASSFIVLNELIERDNDIREIILEDTEDLLNYLRKRSKNKDYDIKRIVENIKSLIDTILKYDESEIIRNNAVEYLKLLRSKKKAKYLKEVYDTLNEDDRYMDIFAKKDILKILIVDIQHKGINEDVLNIVESLLDHETTRQYVLNHPFLEKYFKYLQNPKSFDISSQVRILANIAGEYKIEEIEIVCSKGYIEALFGILKYCSSKDMWNKKKPKDESFIKIPINIQENIIDV